MGNTPVPNARRSTPEAGSRDVGGLTSHIQACCGGGPLLHAEFVAAADPGCRRGCPGNGVAKQGRHMAAEQPGWRRRRQDGGLGRTAEALGDAAPPIDSRAGIEHEEGFCP